METTPGTQEEPQVTQVVGEYVLDTLVDTGDFFNNLSGRRQVGFGD